MQFGVRNDEAAANAEAAGIEVDHEPLPEDRIRPSGRRAVVERRQLRHHPQPRRASRRPNAKRSRARCRRPMSATASRRARFTRAPRPIPPPVRDRRRSYQTTAYVFDDVDHAASLFNLHNFGYIYSRLTNPTVSVLEERVASLEGGRAAVAAASGHAAQFLIFATMLEPGDEFLASRNLYGGSLTQFGLTFKKLGWNCHFVDPLDPENFRRALTPKCKAIFVESLANPGGVVVDLAAIAEDRAFGRHSADRGQYAGDAVSVPAVRVGRRSGHALDHEVPRRPRQFDGRHGGRSRASSIGRRAASSRR